MMVPKATATKTTCTACGMLLDDPGEFHPYVFCVLKKAGRDPWRDFKDAVGLLGLEGLPQKPPLVRHLPVNVRAKKREGSTEARS